MESFVQALSLLAVAAVVPPNVPLAQTNPNLQPAIPEVVIEAMEPRYVAPTRRDRIGRIWAPVLIDGKGPFRLVLDTGATHSVVTNEVALALGNDPGQRGEITLRGVTGVATVATIPVKSFEVGDLLIEPAILPIIHDAMGGADGVLGNEGLKDKRILIEFTRDRISITHSRGERAPVGYTTVPVQIRADGLLLADSRVGLVHAVAVIDTGAQRTLGNIALQQALQAQRRTDGKLMHVIGATDQEQEGDSLSVPSIGLGGASIDGAHVIYADYSIFEHWGLSEQPALIVGMDVLGVLDTLIIDYKRHELQLKGARGWPR